MYWTNLAIVEAAGHMSINLSGLGLPLPFRPC